MIGPDAIDAAIEELAMKLMIPCFGGPFDGRFFPEDEQPKGYKSFPVRKRTVFMLRTIKPEYLDFATLEKASKMLPSAFDEEAPEEGPFNG